MNNYSCYDQEYLIKKIFGKKYRDKEFSEIVSMIIYAVRNNNSQSYLDAGDWFFDRGYFDWGNHFVSIATRIGLQIDKLYRRKNVNI